jgi:hypothetical protein
MGGAVAAAEVGRALAGRAMVMAAATFGPALGLVDRAEAMAAEEVDPAAVTVGAAVDPAVVVAAMGAATAAATSPD